MKTDNNTGLLRKTGKAVLWTVCTLIAMLAIAQAVLSSGALDKLIDRYAQEFIDGNISHKGIRISLFRRFPNISADIQDFNITYPADRFDHLESEGNHRRLEDKGSGETADTLAAFDRFHISINVLSLINGKINIPFAQLAAPRIYAHRYHDGQANWDVIKLPESQDNESEENSSGSLPSIKLGRISMTDHPHIVYTDSKDTLSAVVDLKQVVLGRKGIRLDSLFVAGRTAKDTIAFGMENLSIRKGRESLDLHAKANAMLATSVTGRMRIPIEIGSTFEVTAGEHTEVSIQEMKADIASVPITAAGDLTLMDDRIAVSGSVSINGCKVKEVVDDFVKRFVPSAANIKTDATVTMELNCDGEYVYSTGELPFLSARVIVPESSVQFKGIDNDMKIRLDASAFTADGVQLVASVKDMSLKSKGIAMNLVAESENILSEDPELFIDGEMHADLHELATFLPDTTGIEAAGKIQASLEGRLRPSCLDIYGFSQAAAESSITADSLIFRSPSDSIDINIDRMEITAGPEEKVSKRDSSKVFHLMGIKAAVSRMAASYGALALRGEEVNISAMNSTDTQDTSKVAILGGRLNAKRIFMHDASGTSIILKGTSNGFQMLPLRDRPDVPMLTISSTNERIAMKYGVNRAILSDAGIKASAVMSTVERRQRARNFMDSLARQYPDIPKDSLMLHLRKQMDSRTVPEWLKEEDFRKQDINIKLDETLARYFREWEMNGKLDVGSGILITPYFPARNTLNGLKISFNNDKVAIDSLKAHSGSSEIGAKGQLTGLRRALLGRGGLKLDLDIYSDEVNANELLAAYSAGSRYTPPQDSEAMSEASDEEYLEMVTSDTLTVTDSVPALIVIPSNLNAEIRLNAKDITYSDLEIDRLSSKLLMKERCVQITGTEAASNFGNIDFEGFYSTRTKKDIKAGFSFNFKDITAEKVIGLMPAIDTLIPLLKSFNGQLNCEVAATAGIDSAMNIIPSTINGIMRIVGRNLAIRDSEMYSSLARKLMFKNKKEGLINEMSVEGIISDSMLEVFPFIVKLDRYTLALSGIHNMDESFRYHASLIKSPFLIKLGVDVYGDNFDEMKFKIGKAKFKNTNVPVFSSVIDTTKVNLVNSIRNIFDKGVEAAISENERREAIEKHRKEIGYVRAVDQKLEELSDSEQKQMKEQEAVMKETEEAENKLAETIKAMTEK